jgi:hypothetical protein
MRPTSFGQGIAIDGSGASVYHNTAPTNFGSEATILWVGSLLGAASVSGSLGGITHNSSNSAPYVAVEIKRNSTGNNIFLNFNDGTTFQNITSSGAYTTGDVIVIGRIKSGTQNLYVNGLSVGSNTVSVSSIAFGTNPRLEIGDSLNARNPNAVANLLWIANRYITDAEVAALSANPWQLFQPLPRRIFVASTGTGPTYTLTAAQGSFTLTGQAAGLTASRLLTAAQGSFALTGQAATLKAARLITAAQGSYTLTGQDATLTYTPAVTYTLTAAQGAFTLTGQAAGLTAARLLTAAQGTYSLTGVAAGLTYSGEPQTITTPTARFLRRAPKLPWEQDDEPAQQDVVVAKPRRKRIKLPETEALQAVAADVPVQLVTEITGTVIRVPDIPVNLDDDEDEAILWLI